MKNILISLSAAALVATSAHAAIVINPSAWYDASDASTLTTSGTSVTGWSDKSGNGQDLTSVGSPTLVASAINGMNALEFNRSQEMNIAGTIDFKWAVMVMVYTGGDALSQALGSQSASGGDNYTIQLRADQTPDRWQGGYFMNGRDTSSSSVFTDEHLNAGIVYKTTSLTNFALQVGGDRALNNRGWDGYIAEVLVGNEVLTAGEKDALEGYLAHKWGTAGALESGHAYKSAAPTDLTITVVPEPSALVMGALGGLLLLRRCRALARRRRGCILYTPTSRCII